MLVLFVTSKREISKKTHLKERVLSFFFSFNLFKCYLFRKNRSQHGIAYREKEKMRFFNKTNLLLTFSAVDYIKQRIRTSA